MKKRYLILEDGTIFQGWGFGAEQPVVGELVFTTSVVGYVETLTDPNYFGQIVMQTFPLIGNYGMMEEDFNGKPCCKGYVVKEYCRRPSNFRCEYDLETFMLRNNIPGMYGVDTRELTNRIREYGVVNAMMTDKIPEDLDGISSYEIIGAVEQTTSTQVEEFAAQGEEKFRVTMVDFGSRMALIRFLTANGCHVTSVPAGTAIETVLSGNPDGVVFSDGPGNPADAKAYVPMVQAVMGKKPVFGVGLGHQLMAMAQGGTTMKLKYGHRGANQPCRKYGTKRTYITTQNHGYCVASGSVPGGVESFMNLNDNTVEGMEYPELGAFSVQFAPESCNGPRNSNILMEQFARMMKEGRFNAAE